MVTLSEEIRREVGQHLIFGFHGHQVSEDIKTLVRDYFLGNIILMKRNYQDAEQARKLIQELQQIAKESGHQKPLLIGTDHENGLVSAFSSQAAGTQFPGAMALAATGDVDLAFEVSSATARELKMVGINWVFSPVADVNSDSRNPVIGVRSFGDNPAEVARYAVAVARGHTSCGVAPSAKHFPGHGDTHLDSHLALPIIPKSKDELKKTELVPFYELICSPNPVASVMIGHMALPKLTGTETPASLSTEVVTDLLRKEMNYDGVVVTDCLEMDAIADPLQGGCGVEEGVLRSLMAGADVAMACHTYERHLESIRKVYLAVESGKLSLDKLIESGKRIARMKDAFVGRWDGLFDTSRETFQKEWNILKTRNMELSRIAYRKSSAVVWGVDKLPFKISPDKEVLLFTPSIESVNRAVDYPDNVLRDRSGRLRNTAGASYLALADEIQKRVKIRHVVYSKDDDKEESIDDNVGAIIFVLRNADRSAWQRRYLERLIAAGVEAPMALVASCGPYDLVGMDVLGARHAFLATFEFTRNAFEALVEVILDGLKSQGRVPVQID